MPLMVFEVKKVGSFADYYEAVSQVVSFGLAVRARYMSTSKIFMVVTDGDWYEGQLPAWGEHFDTVTMNLYQTCYSKTENAVNKKSLFSFMSKIEKTLNEHSFKCMLFLN